MVNTLELRGIDAYSPEIQTFVREIERSFLQVLNNCVPADQQEKEAVQLRDTVEGIGNCLEMHCAPGEVFNCFSCGAFKEAYHASDSIVVKFCSTDNETKKEQALLAAAEEADILELFVPTFFHQLPVNLPVTQLDDTNSSRYTYDSHYHTWRQNPFGNLMPFMMMSSVMGDDSDNDFSKMMMMSMMMGGSNPFTAMFTPQDK